MKTITGKNNKTKAILKEAAIEGVKAGVRTATVYITVMSIVGLAEKAMLKSKKRKEKRDNFIKELEEHEREKEQIVKDELEYKELEKYYKEEEQEVETDELDELITAAKSLEEVAMKKQSAI